MSDFSNELKQRADIVKLIGEFVALKPAGNGATGLCPFHGEKSPSFHVHQAKQFYYCFGCHAHGDIFQFFMAMKKLTFPEAVAAVAERMGIALPEGPGGGDGDPQRAEMLRIHTAASAYFAQCLLSREGAIARAYLASRDLALSAWDRFQLGFAPENGRGLCLHLEAKGITASAALRAGVCQLRREAGAHDETPPGNSASWPNLYDRFRGRLMFPIRDDRGRVIAFGGRALESNVGNTGDRKPPKYLNSPESPLYTKGRVLYNLDQAREPIRQLNYVILVEGYFDCIRVFMAGFENVVASCGTALTDSQIKPVARWARKAVINFDPDTAGAAAAERSIGMLLEEGFQMRVVVLPAGLDPDLFIRQQGSAAYGEALKTSRSFFDYLAERARRQFDLRRPDGKVAAINHLLPYLSRVHEPILRQQLAENLAAQLGIEHQSMVSKQLLTATRDRRGQLASGSSTIPELLPAERTVLRAWLEWEPHRLELGLTLQSEGLLEGLVAAPLAEVLFASNGEDVAALAERLEESDRRLLAALLMGGEDEKLTAAAVAGAVEALRERRRPAATRDIQARVQQAAQAGDKALLERLLREKRAHDLEGRPADRASRGAAAGRG